MIDIPTRVKDALREGDRLKKYRFIVENMPQEVWTDVTDYQETTASGSVTRTYTLDSGTYRFTAGEYMLEVSYIESGSQILIPVLPNVPKIITFDARKSVRAKYRVGDNCLVQEQSFEDLVITNDNLVSESVTFDERMCSDKDIKFGLCEGTSLEFQYFGLPNITGKRLQAFIDVQYKDADSELKWYEIPMGWFEVSESSRQASTGIIKVSAFNKLQSDYLNNKANAQLQEIISDPSYGAYSAKTLDQLLRYAFDGYAIDEYELATISYASGLGTTYSIFDIYDANGNLTGESIYVLYPNMQLWMDTDGGQWLIKDAYSITGHVSSVHDAVYENAEYLDEYIDAEQHTLRDIFDSRFFNPQGYAHPSISCTYQISAVFLEQTWSTPIAIGEGIDDLFESPYIQGIKSSEVTTADYYLIGYIPSLFYKGVTQQYPIIPDEKWAEARTNARRILKNTDIMVKHQLKTEVGELVVTDVSSWSDVTLRDLQSAVFEVDCKYGQIDHVTDLFRGITLNNSRLLPAENLYPADTLLPNSMAERSNPSMYSKLWADEGNVRKFRYLIITYKGTEEDPESHQTREVEKVLQRTVNADGTDDYNMSNNWLFKNLVWTDEQIGDYADAMVTKMQNLTWFPFEMWCAGLPYIETGDEVEINVNGEAYTSYVLRRSLKGIQNLRDEMVNGVLDIF